MKKVIISMGLIMALVLTGCAKDEKNRVKKLQLQHIVTIVVKSQKK